MVYYTLAAAEAGCDVGVFVLFVKPLPYLGRSMPQITQHLAFDKHLRLR